MTTQRTKLALTTVLLSSLLGCGGGGGSDSNPDPGVESKAVLDITVTGLVTKLDVAWMGQTITMSPERLSAQIESSSTQFSPPTYQSPKYQNCEQHELGSANNRHSLKINCAEPDTLRLLASATGLRGELKLSWNGEDMVLNEANPNRVVEAKPGEFRQPSITATPELQDCSAEPIETTSGSRAFDYKINCVDQVAVNKIVLESPLPYPVSLLAGEESLSVQSKTTSFPAATSRLDGVVIDNIGGTQECDLEKLDYSSGANEQSWRLACREYLVVTDRREGVAGVYLIYRNGEKNHLESGAVNSAEVKTYTAGQTQIVLHPDFGVKALDFATREVTWKSVDGLPEGRIQQVQVTDSGAYINYVLHNQSENYDYDSIWRIGGDSTPTNLTYSINAGLQLRLQPVSQRDDIVAIDAFDTVKYDNFNRRRVYLSRSGIIKFTDTIKAYSVIGLNKVIHVVEHDANNWFLFHPNEREQKLDFIINKESTRLTSLADPQTNVLTWYDKTNKKRILALGYKMVDGSEPPDPWVPTGADRQLAELVIKQEGNNYDFEWKAPEFVPSVTYGYMGTDGKLLAITTGFENVMDDYLDDELAALITRQGPVDLPGLSEAREFALPLRVQPFERDNMGRFPTYKEVKPVNGWILVFEGREEIGNVWATDGRAEHTWRVFSDVSWEDFKEGNYRLVAAGANMVAVSDGAGELVVLSPELIPR